MARTPSKIPTFDANGNLPPGIYHVSIEDIERRLTYTPRRLELFNGLNRALLNLSAAGVQKVWIDGGFITNDPYPNDVDGCWEYTPGMNVNKLDKVFFDLNPPREAMRRKYGVDFFILGTPLREGKTVEQFFQTDRDGNRKGILIVNIRGLH